MKQPSDQLYSLRRSRKVFKNSVKNYSAYANQLTQEQLKELQMHLKMLKSALEEKDQLNASKEAHSIENLSKTYFKKSAFSYFSELLTAILVALFVAVIVRSMWFELYEIPTGSMRPTFEEQDHLTVTKTTFGINVPLTTAHFYFDPSLVKRAGIVIWSGDLIPHLDADSTFMGFPYTKRFIKRCMAKPGDTIYFYGGQLYGMDAEGRELKELRESPELKKLEYLPFTNFEGRRNYLASPKSQMTNQVVFHLMNKPIGRIRLQQTGLVGEIFNGKKWIVDQPQVKKDRQQTLHTYSDFWGIRNFAMSRLLTKEEMVKLANYPLEEIAEAPLYLELRHTPTLSTPTPLISNRYGISLPGFTTVIPVSQKHLKKLMKSLYTCRFVIKQGYAYPYRLEGQEQTPVNAPFFKGVADGSYEFYYGKGYHIGWGGIATELPVDHPLYSLAPSNVQKLYNLGIEMSTLVEPKEKEQPFYPNRYSYFREGNLYTMGGILFDKNDPALLAFHKNELKREKAATTESPYLAFKDFGPPLNDKGQLNKSFLTTFGYKVPDGHYLMLGDNHAMSQDSRWFGPVPQANLQGTPSLIIWPPGPRLGPPLQSPYALFVMPRFIIWSLALLLLFLWWISQQKKKQQLTFLD